MSNRNDEISRALYLMREGLNVLADAVAGEQPNQSSVERWISECGSGILPQFIVDADKPDNGIIEAIVCDSLSGGARYVNNMPAECSLIRRLLDGGEFRARYRQVETPQIETEAEQLERLSRSHPDGYGDEDFPPPPSGDLFVAPAKSMNVFADIDEVKMSAGADVELQRIKPEVSRLANYLKIYQMLLRDFRPAILKGAHANSVLFLDSAIGWNFPLDTELDRQLIALKKFVTADQADSTMAQYWYATALIHLEKLMHDSDEFWTLKKTAPESAVKSDQF